MMTDVDAPCVRIKQSQLSLRFLHQGEGPLSAMSAYEVRQALKTALPQAQLDAITAQTSSQTVTLVARTPAGHEWINENLGDLMGAMADLAGKELAVTPDDSIVQATATAQLHFYKIPRLIVEKAHRTTSWNGWRTPELSADLHERLIAMITEGLNKELTAWDTPITSPSIILTGEGRGMPISPAHGPRGMARLGVTFISKVRLEGSLFVGLQTLSGNGAVRLCGSQQD